MMAYTNTGLKIHFHLRQKSVFNNNYYNTDYNNDNYNLVQSPIDYYRDWRIWSLEDEWRSNYNII